MEIKQEKYQHNNKANIIPQTTYNIIFNRDFKYSFLVRTLCCITKFIMLLLSEFKTLSNLNSFE